MSGLPAPSGWRVDGERRPDEPGDGRGLRSVGVPLQCAWDEQFGLKRLDHVAPTTGHSGAETTKPA
jgi:hypothetical protein